MFKDCIGKSINSFLLDTRILASRELLMAAELTIEEIALKTGFENVYYFSNCFKKHENITPRKYRMQNIS